VSDRALHARSPGPPDPRGYQRDHARHHRPPPARDPAERALMSFIDFAQKRFAGLGVETKVSEDRKFIVMRQEGQPCNVLVILNEDANLLTATFQPEVKVPADRVAALTEFVVAANDRLRFGALFLSRGPQPELSFK